MAKPKETQLQIRLTHEEKARLRKMAAKSRQKMGEVLLTAAGIR